MPKQTPGAFWVIEHLVQNIGRLFTSEDSEKNVAAENWIDETGGITRKQPAIAGEPRAPIGKVRSGVTMRNATPCAAPIAHERPAGNRPSEKLFGRNSSPFEFRRHQHNPEPG